ncbi:MAG: nuclear transport factor 2 family protein [Porticoccaceae bacterium]
MTTASLTIEDMLAITETIHSYFKLVDTGRAADVYSLFCENGALTFGAGAPKPGTLSGDNLKASLETRQQQTGVITRHAVSNIQFSAQLEGRVSAYSLLTLYRAEPGAAADTYPASVADIDDIFVKENGSWKILQRVISPVFNRQ